MKTIYLVIRERGSGYDIGSSWRSDVDAIFEDGKEADKYVEEQDASDLDKWRVDERKLRMKKR